MQAGLIRQRPIGSSLHIWIVAVGVAGSKSWDLALSFSIFFFFFFLQVTGGRGARWASEKRANDASRKRVRTLGPSHESSFGACPARGIV